MCKGHGKDWKQKSGLILICFDWKTGCGFQYESSTSTLAGVTWCALGSLCRNEVIMPGMDPERMFS